MDATAPPPSEPGREPADAPNPFAAPQPATPEPAAAAARSGAAPRRSGCGRAGCPSARPRDRGAAESPSACSPWACATGGGVAIAATTDTSTPSPTASEAPGSGNLTVEKGDRLLKRGGPLGLKLGMLGHGGMLHGEFTVPDGDGGYRTMITQNGTVESTGGDRLTVKSPDGWSKEYTLGTSTLVGGQRYWSADSNGGLTQGQEVHVVATVRDGVAHAEHVATRLDQAETEKRAGEMKQRLGDRMDMLGDRMEMFGERGEKVFKFRGGPGGHGPGELRMKVPPRMGGMHEMHERHVAPAPEAGATAPSPAVEPGSFTAPAEEVFTVLVG